MQSQFDLFIHQIDNINLSTNLVSEIATDQSTLARYQCRRTVISLSKSNHTYV